MRNKFRMFSFVIAVMLIALLTGCTRGKNSAGPTIAPDTYLFSTEAERIQHLDAQAGNLGITLSENRHLSVGGIPHLRVNRLIAYFNYEAKSLRRDARDAYPYKLSGTYAIVPTMNGFIDEVRYEIQFSSLPFYPPDVLTAKNNTNFHEDNDTPVADSYGKFAAALDQFNAEAESARKNYKVKGRYRFSENARGEIDSDRIDLFLHFSFDSRINSLGLEAEMPVVRSVNPLLSSEKDVIVKTLLTFAPLLKKPEAFTITTLNFVGDAPYGPQWVYMFNSETIKQMLSNDKLSRDEILALAEVKERKRQMPRVKQIIKDRKEPIRDYQKEIIARIAIETARNINPISISIAIYDFEGNALV